MFLINSSDYNIDPMLPLSTWHNALKLNIDYIKYRLDLHPNAMNIVFITDVHVGCAYGVRFNAYSKGKPIDDKNNSSIRGGNNSWYNNTNKINRLDRVCVAIKKLSKQKKIDLIIFGGDYISNNTNTSRDAALAGLYEINSCIKKLNNIAPVIICVGNHDSNTIGNFNRLVTDSEFESILWDGIPKSSQLVYGERKEYGYYDDVKRKTRIIWLNTADIDVSLSGEYSQSRNPLNSWYIRQKQLLFLIDALKIKESGWKVYMFHHHNWMGDTGTADSGGNAYRAALRKIVASFRHNLSGSYIRNSLYDQFDINVSWDFTKNGNNSFICSITGHYHKDGLMGGIYRLSNNVFYDENVTDSSRYNERYGMRGIYAAALCTPNSGFDYTGSGEIVSVSNSDGGNSETNSTVYESSFSVVSIDTTNDIVYINRFGGGFSRQYKYENNVASPNTGLMVLLNKSLSVTVTDASGVKIQNAEVIVKYNGVDIKLNTNSSGVANFTEMPYDKCVISVNADGYKSNSVQISNINQTSTTIKLTKL